MSERANGVSDLGGWSRIACPDYRCNWVVSTRRDAEALLAQHLAADPRHTNGAWTDSNRVTHIGLDDFGPPPERGESGYNISEMGSD